MDIDIIRNKLLFLFCFFSFLGTNYAQDRNCQLYETGVSILTEDYPDFQELLNSYYNDSNLYDYLYIKIVGGNKINSKYKRIYKVNTHKAWNCSELINGQKDEYIIDTNDSNLSKLFDNVIKGEFLNLCENSSLNNTNIYILKKRGEVTFKLVSEPYSILNVKPPDSRIITFLSLLKEIEGVPAPRGL